MTADRTHARAGASPRRLLRRALSPGAAAFDLFERSWEADSTRRLRASAVLTAFVGTIAWIGVGRLGWLPEALLLNKPFAYSIHAAFTLVLISEVVELVLSLPRSVAASAGKQFGLFSLILLRQAFEEFSHRGDTAAWEYGWDTPVMHMIADIGGAVAVFALLAVYARLQLHRRITEDEDNQQSFVAAKKIVALMLLAAFVLVGGWSAWGHFGPGRELALFNTFYVVLIFTDVLVVLLAMRYSADHAVVFRNAGFAACTLLIRVALSAPPYINAALGVTAAGLLVALAATYRFAVTRPAVGIDLSERATA